MQLMTRMPSRPVSRAISTAFEAAMTDSGRASASICERGDSPTPGHFAGRSPPAARMSLPSAWYSQDFLAEYEIAADDGLRAGQFSPR